MLAFLGLVALIFILMFIGMEFFIENYYYREKVQTMQNTIRQIENSKKTSSTKLEYIENLEYLGYHFEGKINVYDVEAGIVISSADVQKYSDGVVVDQLDVGNANTYILETDYPVKDTRWLVYYEQLPDNTIAILQIPVTAIEHTLEVMNMFIIYMIAIVSVIAMIIAAFISSNMTRPIKKLTVMADQIRQLKFDIQYEDNRSDEIGLLGETFNDLSSRLDTTIKALTYELSKEKQLDKLRKEFVAQVSHELQTPLSIIHGYIEALEDGVVDSEEERQEYYQIISDESEKMSRMIKDILQLSELEAGTFKVSEETIDLWEFFDHLNQDYQTLLSHSDLSLNYIPMGRSVEFYGDRMKLEQAFRNMLNNARKYAETGSVITFYTAVNETSVEVCIANDGPQIPEEETERIFGSFYKGRNSEGKEGSGIGLAVAGKVFEYHKMRFHARNTESGVEFVIHIPV